MNNTDKNGPAVDPPKRAADSLPGWAREIVSDTEKRFSSELSDLTQRVAAYQAKQMADFIAFAVRLIDDMCTEIKSKADKNGYSYLSAMKAEKALRAKFGTLLDRLKS